MKKHIFCKKVKKNRYNRANYVLDGKLNVFNKFELKN